MHKLTLDAGAALAFVGALATTGVLSHSAPSGPLTMSDLLDGSLQARYELGFKDANPLKSFAIAARGAVRYAVFDTASDGAILGDNGWIYTAEEFETPVDEAINLLTSAQHIARVVRDFDAQGVRVLPVLVPDKAEIHAEGLAVARPQAVVTRRARLVAHLRAQGIDFVDAAPAMLAAKAEGSVFMRDDTHWSPRGSAAAARAVAQAATNVDYTRAEVTQVAGPARDFDGDLLAFVPTGDLRPWIGPAQQQIAQVETQVASAGGLFGDAVVDVALVGTSYSSRAEFLFADHLRAALGADLINYAQPGQGPFAPMEAMRAELAASPDMPLPKLVIWDIPVRYTTQELNQ